MPVIPAFPGGAFWHKFVKQLPGAEDFFQKEKDR